MMKQIVEWIWPRSTRDDDAEARQEEQRRILAETFHERIVARDAEHRRALGERTWAELTRDGWTNGGRR